MDKTENEIIAEFMGGTFNKCEDGFGNVKELYWFLPGNNPNPHCSLGTYKRVGDLEYHLRWDWLMPVVEKINKAYASMTGERSWPGAEAATRKIQRGLADVNIKMVHEGAHEFISWYSKQNQNHETN